MGLPLRIIASAAIAWVLSGCAADQSRVHQSIMPRTPESMSRPSIASAETGPGNLSTPATQPVNKIDEMDAAVPSSELLAHKAASYSQEMAGKTLPHSAAAQQAPTLPNNPSAVQWMDSNQFSLDTRAISTAPAAAGQAPSVTARPVMDMTAATPARPIVPPTSSDVLVNRFNQRLKENPRDLATVLESQTLAFLEDQSAPDPNVMAPLLPEDRDVLTAVIDGLSNFRDELRADAGNLTSEKIKPLLVMCDRLRADANLAIPLLCICEKVDRFGVFDEIKPARFAAGQDNKMIVYCEVANFTSTLNSKGMYDTHLQMELNLYTNLGQAVWSDKATDFANSSHSRCHDLYLPKMVVLPSNLTIGQYRLKVTVSDPDAKHVVESGTDVLIAASGK